MSKYTPLHILFPFLGSWLEARGRSGHFLESVYQDSKIGSLIGLGIGLALAIILGVFIFLNILNIGLPMAILIFYGVTWLCSIFGRGVGFFMGMQSKFSPQEISSQVISLPALRISLLGSFPAGILADILVHPLLNETMALALNSLDQRGLLTETRLSRLVRLNTVEERWINHNLNVRLVNSIFSIPRTDRVDLAQLADGLDCIINNSQYWDNIISLLKTKRLLSWESLSKLIEMPVERRDKLIEAISHYYPVSEQYHFNFLWMLSENGIFLTKGANTWKISPLLNGPEQTRTHIQQALTMLREAGFLGLSGPSEAKEDQDPIAEECREMLLENTGVNKNELASFFITLRQHNVLTVENVEFLHYCRYFLPDICQGVQKNMASPGYGGTFLQGYFELLREMKPSRQKYFPAPYQEFFKGQNKILDLILSSSENVGYWNKFLTENYLRRHVLSCIDCLSQDALILLMGSCDVYQESLVKIIKLLHARAPQSTLTLADIVAMAPHPVREEKEHHQYGIQGGENIDYFNKVAHCIEILGPLRLLDGTKKQAHQNLSALYFRVEQSNSRPYAPSPAKKLCSLLELMKTLFSSAQIAQEHFNVLINLSQALVSEVLDVVKLMSWYMSVDGVSPVFTEENMRLLYQNAVIEEEQRSFYREARQKYYSVYEACQNILKDAKTPEEKKSITKEKNRAEQEMRRSMAIEGRMRLIHDILALLSTYPLPARNSSEMCAFVKEILGKTKGSELFGIYKQLKKMEDKISKGAISIQQLQQCARTPEAIQTLMLGTIPDRKKYPGGEKFFVPVHKSESLEETLEEVTLYGFDPKNPMRLFADQKETKKGKKVHPLADFSIFQRIAEFSGGEKPRLQKHDLDAKQEVDDSVHSDDIAVVPALQEGSRTSTLTKP